MSAMILRSGKRKRTPEDGGLRREVGIVVLDLTGQPQAQVSLQQSSEIPSDDEPQDPAVPVCPAADRDDHEEDVGVLMPESDALRIVLGRDEVIATAPLAAG